MTRPFPYRHPGEGRDPGPAIAREKQLKAGSRRNKLALIEAMNPDWTDLFDTIVH